MPSRSAPSAGADTGCGGAGIRISRWRPGGGHRGGNGGRRQRGAAGGVSGFPGGGGGGFTAAAGVVVVSYEGEWMEMHAASQDRGQWITQGYSGAGVADEASGDVVGIVVAVREAGSSVNAWMMPVETIRGYLAPVDAYVVGGETTDPAPAGKSSVLVGANAWARPD